MEWLFKGLSHYKRERCKEAVNTVVNLVLQEEQELAKQGKEIQGRAKAKNYETSQECYENLSGLIEL